MVSCTFFCRFRFAGVCGSAARSTSLTLSVLFLCVAFRTSFIAHQARERADQPSFAFSTSRSRSRFLLGLCSAQWIKITFIGIGAWRINRVDLRFAGSFLAYRSFSRFRSATPAAKTLDSCAFSCTLGAALRAVFAIKQKDQIAAWERLNA
jgi:hypothetical protein